MAAVVQQSSVAAALAKKVGARLTQANETHKDTPVDLGNQQLPAGIRDGVAQLNKAYLSTKKEGDFKGEYFFRASAVVKAPTEYQGKRVAGRTTSVMVSLHDEPAKGERKPKTFDDNWGDFLNYLKMFGIKPTTEKDPLKIIQYYEAILKQLETTKPFLAFSTRGWTPKATALKPKPTEMVFEDWHGMVDYTESGDPVADGMAPPTDVAVPSSNGVGTELTAAPFEEPPQASEEEPTAETQSLEDELTTLVDIVNGDPKNETDDGKAARIRLEELAVAAGFLADQVQNAPDWETVAGMAMGVLPGAEAATEPTVGGTYNFRKRDSKGEPLVDKQGKAFDPFEIELMTVDAATSTCTAKTTKDGKPMVGINKKPVQIKWEWLE